MPVIRVLVNIVKKPEIREQIKDYTGNIVLCRSVLVPDLGFFQDVASPPARSHFSIISKSACVYVSTGATYMPIGRRDRVTKYAKAA